MRFLLRALTGCFILLVAAQAAVAGQIEDAAAAYERGDFVTALRLTKPLAERGDRVAQFYVGLMYGSGQGVPQDYAEAAKWYERAADQNLPEAQNNLGLLYFDGHGVPHDNVRAYMWYNLAAGQSFRAAIANKSSIVRLMTGDQISRAQALSREWKPGSLTPNGEPAATVSAR